MSIVDRLFSLREDKKKKSHVRVNVAKGNAAIEHRGDRTIKLIVFEQTPSYLSYNKVYGTRGAEC